MNAPGRRVDRILQGDQIRPDEFDELAVLEDEPRVRDEKTGAQQQQEDRGGASPVH